jgi:flagellar biosynthesis chaperone FliJ
MVFIDRRIEAALGLLVRISQYQSDVNETQKGRALEGPLLAQVATGALGVYLRLESAKDSQEQEIAKLRSMRSGILDELLKWDGEVVKFERLIEQGLLEQAAARLVVEQKATDEISNAKMARHLLNLKKKGST